MPVLPIIYGLLNSRIANILLAVVVGFVWGWWNTSSRWRDYVAQQNAAREVVHQMELTRQAKAAADIALADRTRAEGAEKAADAMQAEINSLKKGYGNAKAGGCVIDRDYARRVRRLDKHGRH